MLTPQYFSSVTLWNRAVSTWSPKKGFAICDTIAPREVLEVVRNESPAGLLKILNHAGLFADSPGEILKSIKSLDDMYNGWVPGAFSEASDRLLEMQRFNGLRPLHLGAEQERPSLPGSLLRIAQVLEAKGPRRIYLDSDVNGLSLLLAQSAEVLVGEADPRSNFWLTEALQKTTAPHQVHLNVSGQAAPSCDLALITASHSAHTQSALQRAFAMTRPGATIAVQVRPPWDEAFAKTLRANKWEVETVHRDIHHWLLPGGIVADGGGDLVLLGRPSELPPELAELSAATIVRDQPYFLLDIDGLPTHSDPGPCLLELADRLAAIAPFPEAFRAHQIRGDRHNLHWGDTNGNGLVIELRPRAGHLLLTFLPYNEALEWATTVLILQSLGSATTRVRPVRTTRAGTTPLFS